jgi:hypothetical protein
MKPSPAMCRCSSLRRLASDPRPLAEPCAETHPAAVMFADISGFTALTELLARQGPAGVERVAAGLNGYFGRLIAIIEAHGGDVVKFAGDALTAVWLQDEDERGIAAASLRAVDCALAIQTGLHGYQISDGLDLLAASASARAGSRRSTSAGSAGAGSWCSPARRCRRGWSPRASRSRARSWSRRGVERRRGARARPPGGRRLPPHRGAAPAEPPGDDRITAAVRRVALARPPVAADTERRCAATCRRRCRRGWRLGQSAWLAELRRVVGAVRQPADAGLPDAAGGGAAGDGGVPADRPGLRGQHQLRQRRQHRGDDDGGVRAAAAGPRGRRGAGDRRGPAIAHGAQAARLADGDGGGLGQGVLRVGRRARRAARTRCSATWSTCRRG